MAQLFANNAAALLTNSPGTGGLTLTVTAGMGVKFPVIETLGNDYFLCTLFKVVSGAEVNHEVVKVTVRTTASPDSLTVVRAQEGTAAVNFVAGDRVELRLTAAQASEGVNTEHAYKEAAPIFLSVMESRTLLITEAGGIVVSLGYGTITLPPLSSTKKGSTTYTVSSIYGAQLKGSGTEVIYKQPDGFLTPVEQNLHSLGAGKTWVIVADTTRWIALGESRNLFATNEEAKTGSSGLLLMSPSNMANSTLGRNQTVTEVQNSITNPTGRVISPNAGPYTEYTNNSGKPIFLSVNVQLHLNDAVDLYVDGVPHGSAHNWDGSSTYTRTAALSAVIKVGGRYSIVANVGGSPDLTAVSELK